MNLWIRTIFSLYRFTLGLFIHMVVSVLGVASPIGRQCRFTLSCSAFAEQQIIKHGWWSGSWRALKRLSQCHPWNTRALAEGVVE